MSKTLSYLPQVIKDHVQLNACDQDTLAIFWHQFLCSFQEKQNELQKVQEEKNNLEIEAELMKKELKEKKIAFEKLEKNDKAMIKTFQKQLKDFQAELMALRQKSNEQRRETLEKEEKYLQNLIKEQKQEEFVKSLFKLNHMKSLKLTKLMKRIPKFLKSLEKEQSQCTTKNILESLQEHLKFLNSFKEHLKNERKKENLTIKGILDEVTFPKESFEDPQYSFREDTVTMINFMINFLFDELDMQEIQELAKFCHDRLSDDLFTLDWLKLKRLESECPIEPQLRVMSRRINEYALSLDFLQAHSDPHLEKKRIWNNSIYPASDKKDVGFLRSFSSDPSKERWEQIRVPISLESLSDAEFSIIYLALVRYERTTEESKFPKLKQQYELQDRINKILSGLLHCPPKDLIIDSKNKNPRPNNLYHLRNFVHYFDESEASPFCIGAVMCRYATVLHYLCSEVKFQDDDMKRSVATLAIEAIDWIFRMVPEEDDWNYDKELPAFPDLDLKSWKKKQRFLEQIDPRVKLSPVHCE